MSSYFSSVLSLAINNGHSLSQNLLLYYLTAVAELYDPDATQGQ